jgi:hypothetical protein
MFPTFFSPQQLLEVGAEYTEEAKKRRKNWKNKIHELLDIVFIYVPS